MMFDPTELEHLFPSVEEAEPKETYLSKLDKMPPVCLPLPEAHLYNSINRQGSRYHSGEELHVAHADEKMTEL
jgi:hypothetical protein